MIDFHTTTDNEAEYYYICADSFSFPAVLAQVRALGIPIPKEAIQVIDIFNKLNVVFKKLNLSLRIEGGVVIGTAPATPNNLSALETAFGSDHPKYGWADMKVIDKTSCTA